MTKEQKTVMVKLDSLTPNPKNFYKSSDLDKSAMASSIREHGIGTSIIAKEDDDKPGYYIIVGGHLRVAGAQIVGLKEVPVIVKMYGSPEEEYGDLLLGNEYRTKTKREVAMEMSIRKQIWAKPACERSDLYSPDGQALKSTRERLAERYKMSEANVGKYETILEKRPSLFDAIDNNYMSIDGAWELLRYLDTFQLTELDDVKMMLAVVERVSEHLIHRVNSNAITLEAAFYSAVKTIAKMKRPKARPEGEASNEELSPVGKKSTEKPSGENQNQEEGEEDEAAAVNPDSNETPETESQEQDAKATGAKKVSLRKHRCDVAECPCYGHTVHVVDESSDESEAA